MRIRLKVAMFWIAILAVMMLFVSIKIRDREERRRAEQSLRKAIQDARTREVSQKRAR